MGAAGRGVELDFGCSLVAPRQICADPARSSLSEKSLILLHYSALLIAPDTPLA
jgi:hypothetical protein